MGNGARTVDDANGKGEAIIQCVMEWQKEAEPKVKESDKNAVEDPKCFFGWCPNLKYRYDLSKKAEEDAHVLDKLLDLHTEFKEKVSQPYDPKVRWATPSESYVAFDSRESILSLILEASKDDTVKVIGVHGEAGVGKTTLINRVSNMAKADEVFDWVALANVTKTPDVKNIQRELAECIGDSSLGDSPDARASKLRTILGKKKKVLVILDNMWVSLKLEEVGIPFGDHQHRGCKALESSRDPNVLFEMNADKSFPVHVLKEDEAWNLFKKIVGDRVNDADVQSKALDACRRCGGLPLTIVTTANYLKKAPPSEWETASKLQISLSTAIESSFNQLATDELKSSFQLCSLMPYNATIFDLMKYSRAFGLLRGNETTKEAHRRLYRLVQYIKSTCLLFDGRMAKEFAMHEVIRDVAASIASRKGLPDRLEWLQLKAFQLYNKNPSLRITDQFFSKMEELQVLDVKGVQNLSLLPSLHEMVETMKKPEILSLYDSIIEALPEEIGQLTQLKVLNLDNCSKLSVIPPDVISKLSRLEEMHIGNSFAQWEDGQTAGRHASLSELNQLPDLTSLNLHIPDYSNMPKRTFSDKLQRFKILIGNRWDWSDKHEASRMLKSVRDFLNNFNESRTGFPQLKYLHIQNGPETRHIINLVEEVTLVAFPVLESLYLQNLVNLERIRNAQLEMQPFAKLREITVESCYRLKHLFSFSIARGLQQLEEIQVADCRNMVGIITEGRGSDVGDDEATTTVELEHLRPLTLQQLPKLIGFNASSTTVALFNEKVTIPSLQNFKLSSINASRMWQEQLFSVPTCIQNLTTITVEGCDNLKFLLSSSMVPSLEQLIHLEISDYKLMAGIIEEAMTEERMEKIVFPKLSSLKIKGLPRLTRFCSGKAVQFPSLNQLRIEHCPKLGTFISNSMKKGIQPLFDEKVAFPSLEKMVISQLRNLKILWNDQLPESSFCELKTMEVENCSQLQTVFPFNMVERFRRLQALVITGCASLE
ncbi:probable disease resistance protein At4g27220 [Hibiscus syriacus]|uniref:probable disease resistance protein At4g27220 n=1 Tax=Hibiscus syriacus TaxID=106335 RepID=UPI001923F35E|nr:probable disease resistance protein At4g27220 [Hibiscus syriacus]